MRPIFGTMDEELTWSTITVLRGHSSDVYDISWSNDSQYLVSGSIDNNLILWNVKEGVILNTMTAHTHFVQGVTVDPFFRIIVSLSSDRTVRIWKKLKTKGRKKAITFYHSNVLSSRQY